uniref:Unkown protein n=1 Tax=Riptortus pedestris TaxID=329032 RepID=R4WJR5_RIPPE|nr:unkown protein [Riptortus pedestris]
MDYSSGNIIKVLFGIHFTLISLGIQGYWSPDSYLFYNLLFLLTVLWSIHNKDNVDSMQIAIGINLVSIFLDIITLAGYFPTTNRYGGEKFSASMAIINLLIRPVSLIFMSRNCNQRMGLDADNFSNIFSGSTPPGRNTYEDIGN